MEQRRILCYGDSNTWGTIPRWEDSPIPSDRYDDNTRWTKVAEKWLGEGYSVVEEGLSGRTTIYDLPGEPWENGKPFLKACLMTHRQIDLVILMLGTNDLQLPLDQIVPGEGIRQLIDIIRDTPKCGRGYVPPKILVIAPIEVRPADPRGRVGMYATLHGDEGRAISLTFPELYEKIAREKDCYYLNAGLYAKPSPGDGIHFLPEGHLSLGKAVAEKVKEIFA